jgi:hypothetical protein
MLSVRAQDVTSHCSHSRPALKLPSLLRPSCATITVPCSSTFSALDAFLGVNGTVDVGVVATGCGTCLYAAVHALCTPLCTPLRTDLTGQPRVARA